LDYPIYREARDPKRHYVIQQSEVVQVDEFINRTHLEFSSHTNPHKRALVVIHGTNINFEDAMLRATDIALRLNYTGAIFVYSWPSTASPHQLQYDLESAYQSRIYLRDFLKIVLEQTGFTNVDVFADRMGNIPLFAALKTIHNGSLAALHLNKVLFWLPDIDRDFFSETIDKAVSSSGGFTLYVASEDKILGATRNATGAPRAGEIINKDVVVAPGVDTIDVTQLIETPILELNHDMYQEKIKPEDEIRSVLDSGTRLPTGEPKRNSAGDVYWAHDGRSPPRSESPTPFTIVPVLFGTNRKAIKGDTGSRVNFGWERSEKLSLGRAVVSVPLLHKLEGGIERPSWWDILRLRNPVTEDPKRHFTVQGLEVFTDRGEFIKEMRNRIADASLYKNQAFVFVHGYNVTFDNALYRAAQLAYDIGFDGVPCVFSWPSGGELTDYIYDEESARLSAPRLQEFIQSILEHESVQLIHLIGHSMGNSPLLGALLSLARTPGPLQGKVNQVILAAPDISVDEFRQVADSVTAVGRRFTLYASGTDKAMLASREVRRGVPRIGDVTEAGPIIVPKIDTLDATAVSMDVLSLNHSAFAETEELIKDLSAILKTGDAPFVRNNKLIEKHVPNGIYWLFPKQDGKP
jgi:esterase/lipase superfamily enzyme